MTEPIHKPRFSAARACLERWTRPADRARSDPLRYWQERLLLTVLLASVGFGFLAYVPSMWLSIKERLWSVALADTLIYAFMVVLFFHRRLPFAFRAGGVVSISYVLGLVLLGVLGPFGAGPVWLFAFPVFAGILMGLRASVVALVVNGATLTAIGLWIGAGSLPWPTPAENPAAKWLVSAVNFMLLDTVAAISITVLLSGLRSSLFKEKSLRESVEEKHRDLETAHRNLALETRERQAAADSLKESQERLKAILDSVNTGIWIIDAQSEEIVDANPAAASMMGADGDRVLGRLFPDCIDESKAPSEIRSGLSSREGREAELICEDGSRRPVMINTVPVTLNQRPHLLASFLDIARLREAEEDRTRLERELAQARKMEAVGTLAGGIAHDFNNILSAVIGFAELALDEADGNIDLHDHLEEVIRAGERARELVRQILAFSRQDQPRPEPMVLGKIVAEALRLMRATLPASIVIHERIESEAAIVADPTQMHQVIMNLCTNAWHAMEDDRGRLEVGLADHDGPLPRGQEETALAPGDYLHLWIRDTGVGMAPETAQRIFEPFFTTKESGRGTGMGLSVVHGIVKSHGGTISVESVVGEGTTFHIYLPVASQDMAVTGEDVPGPALGGSERILLVDDEPQVVAAHERSLRGLGYRVAAEHDGITALARLQADPAAFDLVISDVAMPGMAGDALMQAVHHCRPDLPVILCTGYSRRLSGDAMTSLGAAAVAFKPISRKEMARLVRDVLDRREA